MEDFLGHLASKAELHKAIDEIPEGQQAWLITTSDIDDEHSEYIFRSMGDVTLENTLWMMETLKLSFLTNG